MVTQSSLSDEMPTLGNQVVASVPKQTLSHSDCVNAAAKYMSKRAPVVLPEFYSWNAELPDVIAFTRSHTYLVECKVSRGDFLSDKKKHFRMFPEKGMGDYRYYCCPKGMIDKSELPDGWGLLYVYPSGQVRQIKDSRMHDKSKKSEHHLLFYYARRANFAGVHKVILEYRGFDS